MNGYAVSPDGSWRAVSSDMPLAPGEAFQATVPPPSQAQLDKEARVRDRLTGAYGLAKQIPNWATWSQADWAAWYNANISSNQINNIASLSDAKAMLNKMSTVINNLAKLEITLRDYIWPDLPEG